MVALRRTSSRPTSPRITRCDRLSHPVPRRIISRGWRRGALARIAVALACAFSICPGSLLGQDLPDGARFEAEIRAFEAADSATAPPHGAVLMVGSSTIRLWDSAADDFPNHEIVRRGFGGSQFSDLLFYANRIVFPYAPRIIVVYEGDNDLEAGKTPAQVYGDYREFVGRVRERTPGVRVAFIAIKPSIARRHLLGAARETNRLIAEHAATRTDLDYVDVATPMLDRSGEPRASLLAEDGLHLNAEGYALWRDILAPYLD